MKNAGIPGANREIYPKGRLIKGSRLKYDGSVSMCQRICVSRPWCKSVDHDRKKRVCFVQPVAEENVPLKKDYRGNPYDHYFYRPRLKGNKVTSQRPGNLSTSTCRYPERDVAALAIQSKTMARATRALNTLHQHQSISLPDIEMCISGNDGIVKSKGAARKLSELTSLANSIVSISKSTGVGTVTFLANLTTTWIASRFDRKMSTNEAIRFYRDYMRLKTNLNQKIIGAKSCMQHKMKNKIRIGLERMQRAMDKIVAKVNQPPCTRANRYKYETDKRIGAYFTAQRHARNALKAKPNYRLDLTSCNR